MRTKSQKLQNCINCIHCKAALQIYPRYRTAFSHNIYYLFVRVWKSRGVGASSSNQWDPAMVTFHYSTCWHTLSKAIKSDHIRLVFQLPQSSPANDHVWNLNIDICIKSVTEKEQSSQATGCDLVQVVFNTGSTGQSNWLGRVYRPVSSLAAICDADVKGKE